MKKILELWELDQILKVNIPLNIEESMEDYRSFRDKIRKAHMATRLCKQCSYISSFFAFFCNREQAFINELNKLNLSVGESHFVKLLTKLFADFNIRLFDVVRLLEIILSGDFSKKAQKYEQDDILLSTKASSLQSSVVQ